MDKVRLAGSLELSCESKNKKDREGTLESREYMIVLGVKKAEGWTREQCGEWTEERMNYLPTTTEHVPCSRLCARWHWACRCKSTQTLH